MGTIQDELFFCKNNKGDKMIVMPPNIIWRMHGVEPGFDFDFSKKDSLIAFGAFIILSGALVAYMLCQKTDWEKDCKKAHEQGAEQLITYAYSLAAKSVDTVNFANYKMIPQRQAERDSVRSARKIRKFVKKTGIQYIGYNRQWAPVLRTGAVVRDPEFQELSKKYQTAAQRLIVQRKILSSEHK